MLKKKALSLMIAWTLLVSSITFAPVSEAAEAAQDIYVMSYHTSGTSGTNMTYMDDSLHLAYSYDASHWTALGDNNGILFKKNSGYQANPANGLQYRDPFLFRKQDGSFVLLATIVTSAGATTNAGIFAWDSKDLLHYTNERTLPLNKTAQPAKSPQARYNEASGQYELYWTNGTTVYTNTTTDFMTVSDPVAYQGALYPAAKPVMESAPAKAISGSVVRVTPNELGTLLASVGTPKMPTGTKPIMATTALGVAPALPGIGEVVYSDGTIESKGVEWDAIAPAAYAKEGTFKVKGKVKGTSDIVNPLIKNGADPNIEKSKDGKYYFTSSYMDVSHNGTASYQYDRITLRGSSTVQGLASAEEKTIWLRKSSGEMSFHIWAPEIHYMNGKWYIYFAAGRTTANFDLRVYVLECATDDPMTGAWNELGKVAMQNEAFDLDSTIFEHNGEWYMIWAFANSSLQMNSSLRIAKLTSPTTLGSTQVNIAVPEYTWEQRRDNVVEGPDVIKRNGKIFVTYSAGSTDSTYAIGLLSALDSPSTDLLDPAAWTKTPYPIMATSKANGQFGPGHGTFTVAEDGTSDLYVYHARKNEQYSGVNSYNPLYDASRWARVQNVYWHEDGTPYLGVPVADGNLPGAAVEATVTVIAPAGTVYAAEESVTIEAGDTHQIVLKKADGTGQSTVITTGVTYSSSATAVAKVSQTGVVKAQSQGTAIIAAQYEGHTYTIQITVPAAVSDKDLLLWYSFDETGGTVATDHSGKGNDGTYVRTPAFGTGVNGGSFKMSGGASTSTTAPYVKIPNGILKGTDNITISTYVKFTNTTTKNQFLYGLGADSNRYLFTSPYNGSNILHSAITTATWSGEQLWQHSSALPGNVWKQLTVVVNSDEHLGVMYLDGVEVARNSSVTIKPSELYDATKDFSGYIGKSFYSGDPYFGGEVDDFRIYNKALTSWEVRSLYEEANIKAIAADAEELQLGDTSAVIDDLILPSQGSKGSSIAWHSSDASVVGTNGVVRRPAPGEGNRIVTLTATLQKGSFHDTKDFLVTVLSEQGNSISAILSGTTAIQSGETLELIYGLSGVDGEVYAQDITFIYDQEQLEFMDAVSRNKDFAVVAVSDPAETAGQIRIIAARIGQGRGVDGEWLTVRWRVKASQASVTVVYVSNATVSSGDDETDIGGAAHSVNISMIDKSVLAAMITEAQSKHDGASEGTTAGQYPVGSKAILQAAIHSAQATLSNSAANQQQIEEAAAKLGEALNLFLSKVITRTPGDLNGDSRFSIGDLAIIASYYGKTSSDQNWTVYRVADLNNDGMVDIVDLSTMAQLILKQ